jgi:TonB family protein
LRKRLFVSSGMDLSPLSLSDLVKLSSPAKPLPPSDYPLNLQFARRDVRSYRQIAAIGAGSVLFHLVVFLFAIEIPSFIDSPPTPPRVVERRTPLYFPLELTQKAPNRNKVSKQIDLASLLASQQQQNEQRASPNASVKHFEPPQNIGSPQTAKPLPRIMPDAPNLAMNQTPSEGGVVNGLPSAPPPPQTGPSPFQSSGTQVLRNPQTKPEQTKAPPPPGTVRPALSDDNQSIPAPALPGVQGQTGAQQAAIELKSDPQGADFKPYLTQILAIVRANWYRVMPEAARNGRSRGRTVVEFVINRDGSIARVITAQPSGLNQLDLAASTSLVMSSPLPTLPPEFKGYQVRLAFTFAYNMPTR